MSRKIEPSQINIAREGLHQIGEVLESLSKIQPEKPDLSKLSDRAISGNKIHGGTITGFKSVGIQDKSSQLVVLVNDNGILTDSIDVENLIGDTTVTGDLTVNGQLSVKKLHVEELTSDADDKQNRSIEFVPDDKGLQSKGFVWLDKEAGINKRLSYRSNPDRLWTDLSVDLHKEQVFSIGGSTVLSQNELGTEIKKSSLQKLGTLLDLKVNGNINVDQFLFWNSDSSRLGLGTDAPNALFSAASLDAEFIIEPEGERVKLGNYTTSDLEIITDDTARITITSSGAVNIGNKGDTGARLSVHGRIGAGVNNVPEDVSIQSAGAIRFQDKKFQVGSSTPTHGQYRKGDIVWNEDPKPTGYVGWICIREGTPGEWKPFGQIAS